MPKFSSRSANILAECHTDLQRVFNEVIKSWDCTVIEGKRSEEKQKENVAKGVSKTLNSKHVYPLGQPSLAVDVAPYPVVWGDTNRFYAFAGFVLGTAAQLGIKLRWGGDWDSDRDLRDQKFIDLPHFELVVDSSDFGIRVATAEEQGGSDQATSTG